MGLAKHHEKILEIVFERMEMLETRKCESEINVVCSTSSTLITNVSVNSHNEWHLDSPESECKFEDKYIICLDCGKKFLFSARSQKYFADKKWDAPKRCKCCRDSRNIRYLMCASF